jgi:hypothetical protein
MPVLWRRGSRLYRIDIQTMNPVIRVENLGKRYRIGMAPLKYETLSGKITDALRAPLRALRRIQTPKADGADTIWASRAWSCRWPRSWPASWTSCWPSSC